MAFITTLMKNARVKRVWYALLQIKRAIIDGYYSIYSLSIKVAGGTGIHPFETETVVWDDLRFPVSSTKKLAGKEPTSVVYKGGLVWSFEDSKDMGIAFNAQLPHSYKLGENIEFHIHATISEDGRNAGGVENIKLDLTYSWAYVDGEFPTVKTITETFDVTKDIAGRHFLFDLGDIPVSDANGSQEVSSMLICSLTRDVSVANNYTHDLYFMEADFHIPSDTLGSRTKTAK